MRRILRLGAPNQPYQVRYGGWSGKPDEIAIVTRSMLQVMLELGILAQVPESDIAGGRATPGTAAPPSPVAERPPLLNIRSGASPPPESYVAVPYKERWFWISEDDIRSKSIFTSVMLLFSISDVGVRPRRSSLQLNFRISQKARDARAKYWLPSNLARR
jgi:hypothetical protein